MRVKRVNRCIKCTAYFLLLNLLLFTPIHAFAMDTAFIDRAEVWYEREDVVHTPEKSLNKYSGTYSYYIDAENHCFYLHISYIEKSLTDGNNEIKVQFEIQNTNESYGFYVNQNGFISPDDKTKKAFDLACNFGEDTKQGQEIFLGLEFKNKADKTVDNKISFSILVNSTPYSIAENLLLPFQIEETTKEKTTKKQSKTTNRSKTSKSSTEKTTKFKYIATPKSTTTRKHKASDDTYNNSDSAEYVADEQEEDFSDDSVEDTIDDSEGIITEEENQGTLSTQSKLLIAGSVGSFATAAAVLGYNSYKNKKIKKDD